MNTIYNTLRSNAVQWQCTETGDTVHCISAMTVLADSECFTTDVMHFSSRLTVVPWAHQIDVRDARRAGHHSAITLLIIAVQVRVVVCRLFKADWHRRHTAPKNNHNTITCIHIKSVCVRCVLKTLLRGYTDDWQTFSSLALFFGQPQFSRQPISGIPQNDPCQTWDIQ